MYGRVLRSKVSKWHSSKKWTTITLSALSLAFLLTGMVIALPRHQSVKADSSSDWPTYMANIQRSGFNGTETVINATSAPNLKVHWTLKGGSMSYSQPVVANGMIYWGTWDGYEHATDLNGKALIWQQFLGHQTSNCGARKSFGVIGTAAVTSVLINGIMTSVVYVGGGDHHLYALDASTGAIIWNTPLGTSSNSFIWDSPVVYNNSVYVGIASVGDCPLIPGQMFRIDPATGLILNTFNVVPNGCIGGGIWGSPTIDSSDNSIYFATGNASRCPNPAINAMAIVKLSASDLSFISSWQIPKAERLNDGDFGATSTLFQATNGITVLQLVGIANKNGTYYAFDRTAISSGPVWRAHIAVGGACPECGFGSISSGAWDGTLLYVAGGNTTINGNSCKGSVRALDPAAGHFTWEHCLNDGTVLGAVTAVPGVVAVVAGPDLVLVDATSGNSLFSYRGLSSSSHFFGSPSISNGVLFLGNNDHRLYALGT